MIDGDIATDEVGVASRAINLNAVRIAGGISYSHPRQDY